jgi:hypothetical protein
MPSTWREEIPASTIAWRTALTMAEMTEGGLLQVQNLTHLEGGHRADDPVFHELDAHRVARLGPQTQQNLAAAAGRLALPDFPHPSFVQQLGGDLRHRAHAQPGQIPDLGARQGTLPPDDIQDEIAVQRLDQVAVTASGCAHSNSSLNEIRLTAL